MCNQERASLPNLPGNKGRGLPAARGAPLPGEGACQRLHDMRQGSALHEHACPGQQQQQDRGLLLRRGPYNKCQSLTRALLCLIELRLHHASRLCRVTMTAYAAGRLGAE